MSVSHAPARHTSTQQADAAPATRERMAPRSNGAVIELLNDRQVRAQATAALSTWLTHQQTVIAGLEGAPRVQRAEAVLNAFETAWDALLGGLPVDEMQLPDAPTAVYAESLQVVTPPELISDVRPIITLLDAGVDGVERDPTGGPEASAHNGIDWNTRLSVPEYRTQSDNLVAPEATCAVTTLAMVLERLGIGRDDVVSALDERIKQRWIDAQRRDGAITAERARQLEADLDLVDEEPGWDRDAAWQATARRYLDAKMNEERGYQRVRGEASVSAAVRDDLAGDMLHNAQLEDLVDLLAFEIGHSRYASISQPEALLDIVSNTGWPAEGEVLWGGTWSEIKEQVRSALEDNGAAAMSFFHKGNRSNGTHIVAIQEVRDDGFVIDDPYGMVRETYNRRAYDDAYWSETDGRVSGTRDRANARGEFDDWGAAAARSLADDETLGRDSFFPSRLVERSLNYITLFERGVRVPNPRRRPDHLGQ